MQFPERTNCFSRKSLFWQYFLLNKLIYIPLLLTSVVYPQEKDKEYYYYQPELDYGTELSFNPATVVLNGTFDILRNGAHSKNILEQQYINGIKNVWLNISHPIKNIEQYGWNNFISQEVLPLNLNQNGARHLPNYMHHLIGSGMIYKKMAEWYDYHGIKYPHFFSIVTSMLYHYMNESLENGGYQGSNTDPIADLLIFDPLGMLLFSINPINRFFSETLILNDWSLQPVINPWNQRIDNAGQQFVMKYQLPFAPKYSVFLYWGINGIFGLSYTYKKEHNFSFGLGQVVNKLNQNLLRKSRFMTPEIDGAIGFFYDRNHSLLLSVFVSGPRMYNVRINAYPGLIKFGWFKPGFYLGFGEWDHLIVGLTLAHVPLGISVGGAY